MGCGSSIPRTTLHINPLTFAVFPESRPQCSSPPPSQASTPAPSNLSTHQKASFPGSSLFSLHLRLKTASWYLAGTLCYEKIKWKSTRSLFPSSLSLWHRRLAPPQSGAKGPSEVTQTLSASQSWFRDGVEVLLLPKCLSVRASGTLISQRSIQDWYIRKKKIKV